jgi:hypothetical protein
MYISWRATHMCVSFQTYGILTETGAVLDAFDFPQPIRARPVRTRWRGGRSVGKIGDDHETMFALDHAIIPSSAVMDALYNCMDINGPARQQARSILRVTGNQEFEPLTKPGANTPEAPGDGRRPEYRTCCRSF